MLNLYRRHVADCPHRTRRKKNCACPVWVQGTLNGKWVRRSLGIRNWESAQKLVRNWEAGEEKASASVNQACDRFYADAEARGLGPAHLGKLKLLTAELKARFGDRIVAHVTADDLREYREGWELSPLSAQKKIERLRSFFKFSMESGWTGNNPAKVLKPPKVKPNQVMPFSKEDLRKVTEAVEKYPDRPKGRRAEVRAFTALLRYSGLRIGDAVNLTADKVKGGKLQLYTGKTGTPVWMPLPREVISSLKGVAKDGRYFWTGNGTLKSAVSSWQRTLLKLFKLAGVEGHAHMFRHTVATALLSKGDPLETVAAILGHSAKICERHYAPWVKSRQVALEEAVMKAWQRT